jgi:hypothetical protein
MGLTGSPFKDHVRLAGGLELYDLHVAFITSPTLYLDRNPSISGLVWGSTGGNRSIGESSEKLISRIFLKK